MQHSSLYALTKEWFCDGILTIKQGSLEKTNLNISVTVASKYLTSFVINKFPA